MSRDGTREVCCGGARAILVSSESPVSPEHEYHEEYGIGPASRELVVDAALCPGLARVRDARDGKHAGSLSRAGGRSRRRFHPAISSYRLLHALIFPSPSHTIASSSKMISMLDVILELRDSNVKAMFSASKTTSSSALVDYCRP